MTRRGTVRPGRRGVERFRRARGVRAGGRARLAGAFTLIEVVLAVAITALIAAAVVPLSLSLIERADARAVVDRLSAAVRLATAEAARRGAVVTLCAREQAGFEGDLVLRVTGGGGVAASGGAGGGVADQVVDLGVEMPRGWRVEGVDDESVPSAGSGPLGRAPGGVADGDASGVLMTPIGSAFPDGRFVGLAVVATTGERGTGVKTPRRAPGPGAASDEPPRLDVKVDALNGRVTLTPIDAAKDAKAPEPAPDAPSPATSRSSMPPPPPAPQPPPPAPAPSASGRDQGQPAKDKPKGGA